MVPGAGLMSIAPLTGRLAMKLIDGDGHVFEDRSEHAQRRADNYPVLARLAMETLGAR